MTYLIAYSDLNTPDDIYTVNWTPADGVSDNPAQDFAWEWSANGFDVIKVEVLDSY